MSAIASTIFKIKAVTDFMSPDPSILSFRNGQPFYALAADHDKGVYHVSTQYATPFARNAVYGLVPIKYFVQVDLMSKERAPAAAHRSASTSRAPVTKPQPNPREGMMRRPSLPAQPSMLNDDLSFQKSSDLIFPTREQWQQLMATKIAFIEVLSVQTLPTHMDLFRLRVVRGNYSQIVARSTHDISLLHKTLVRIANARDIPSFPLWDTSLDAIQKQAALEHYMNSLISSPCRDMIRGFFKPRDEKEFSVAPITRRDSGFDEPMEKKPRKFSNSIFSQIFS